MDNQETPTQRMIRKYFSYKHLPEHLATISAEISDLAKFMEGRLPDGPEKTAGMRKLLEAKDCFVRAVIED